MKQHIPEDFSISFVLKSQASSYLQLSVNSTSCASACRDESSSERIVTAADFILSRASAPERLIDAGIGLYSTQRDI
jgi:hypothetical protein